MERSDDQLLASFNGSLFDYSRAWELTSSDSLPMFLNSLFCNYYLFFLFFIFFLCNFLTLPYDFLHEVVFLNIHLYYLSKKRKFVKHN